MARDEYTHPEFGFLSPTPRLRRELRIALVSGLFGAVAATAGVLALSASYRDADWPTVASVMTADTPVTVSPNEQARSSGTGAPDKAGPAPGPSAASPAEVVSNPSHGTVTESPGSAQKQATAAAPDGFGMQDRAHSGAVPPKPRQPTSRSQNRERHEALRDWRAEREDLSVGRVNNAPVGRDGSYSRQGFWDWSR
jgi:hypothetical protein